MLGDHWPSFDLVRLAFITMISDLFCGVSAQIRQWKSSVRYFFCICVHSCRNIAY